jgi:hypothetical protein
MVRSISRDIALIGVPRFECSWSFLKPCVVHDFRIGFLPFAISAPRKEAAI